MKTVDYVSEILKCCQKREEILIKKQSMNKYNQYFDIMRKNARKLIDEKRYDELLPYLESESISIRSDVASLLFHIYPELCTQKIQEIADMSPETGLPKHFIILAVSASSNLEYGIPKDFP